MFPVDEAYSNDMNYGDVVPPAAPQANAWLKRLKKMGRSAAEAYATPQQQGDPERQQWNPVNTYQNLGGVLGSALARFGTGGYVDEPTLAEIGEEEPEYVVPRSKVGGFAASVAAGAPVDPAAIPEDDAGPLPPKLGAPGGIATPPFLPNGPKPLGPPAQQPPRLPGAPELKAPSLGRRIAAGVVGGLAGLANARGRSAPIDAGGAVNAVLYPGAAREQANYQARVQQAQQQQALDKGAADLAESQAKTKLYGQQADTMAEEGKRAPRGNYVPFGGDGIFDASAGKVVREPSNKAAADYMEISPEKGKALGLTPTQDGRYVIPKEGIGAYFSGQMRPERPEPQKIPGRDVPFSPEVEAQRKRMANARPPAGGAQTGSEADDIAQAIIEGRQPPDMKGLYRFGGPVRAKLGKAGYDLTTAQKDWQAVSRHISTLNGPQQERLRQAVNFTYDSLDQIEQLYDEWKKVAGVSGLKVLNKANLAVSKQLGGKAGEVAQNLEAQINDLTSELGTVYKGGNSSTDESLRLAGENLKADWNEQTFKRALQQIRKNLQIRRNSIMSSEPVGVSPNSPYAGGRGAAQQATQGVPEVGGTFNGGKVLKVTRIP